MTVTDPDGDSPALSRRAVAAAGLGVALTAACSPGNRSSGATSDSGASPGPSAGSSSATGEPSEGPDLDPDEQLLLDALGAESRVRDRLDQARRRHRSLRRVLAGTLEVHQRHVDLLASAVQNPETGKGDGHGPAESATKELTALARIERDVSRHHARLAMDAASGQVARLLGSLSAAAAQQSQVLGTTEPQGRGPA